MHDSSSNARVSKCCTWTCPRPTYCSQRPSCMERVPPFIIDTHARLPSSPQCRGPLISPDPARRQEVQIDTTEQPAELGHPDYAVLPEDCSRLAGLASLHKFEFAVADRDLAHLHCCHSLIGSLGDPVFQLNVAIFGGIVEVLSVLPLNFKLAELEILVVSGIRHVPGPNLFHFANNLRALRLVSMRRDTMAGVLQDLETPRPVVGHPCRSLTDIELVDLSFDEQEQLAEGISAHRAPGGKGRAGQAIRISKELGAEVLVNDV
ncbi:hypothetical protein OH76DRAFT_125400 [Lentinus brumalis]|uniref:Uncharacterized protein n=1 Tax=Lentinus brumalis TaxID=2498619 RepID=A0A371DJQ9_9APHY|nr:hypothetical protein OH76DRAFT_125400 [Polyporus brumalis]